MTIQQAIKKVVANYDSEEYRDCRESRGPGGRYSGHPDNIEAVWVARHHSPDCGSWQTDEEWLGIRLNGEIVWAYASGCSCWSGEYEVKKVGGPKDLKIFKFHHDKLPKDWKKAIIKFAETGKQQEL